MAIGRLVQYMFFRLLLLLTLVPFVELVLLLRIAAWINWWPTVGLILSTGFLGAWLARREGLKVIRRIQADLADGIAPTSNVVDGALILVAGLVLVTPGILTDVAGFALLVPWVRGVVRRKLERWFQGHIIVMSPEPQEDFVDVDGRGYDPPGSTPALNGESQDVQ